jgi:hypothetical protein
MSKSVWFRVSFVAGGLALLASCQSSPGAESEKTAKASSAVTGAQWGRIAIPSYIPTSYSSDWSRYMSDSSPIIFVIINNGSYASGAGMGGPGATVNAALQQYVQWLHDPDTEIFVLGYVDYYYQRPSTCAASVDCIDRDVQAWKAYGVDGIYFDQAIRDPSDPYYEVGGIGKARYWLSQARTQFNGYNGGPGWAVFGWGQLLDNMRGFVYCLTQDAAGPYEHRVVFSSYEGKSDDYFGSTDYDDNSWWVNQYNPNHFMSLLHSWNTNHTIESIFAHSADRNALYTYVSDIVYPGNDPWHRLAGASQSPQYQVWHDEWSATGPLRTFAGVDQDSAQPETCYGLNPDEGPSAP